MIELKISDKHKKKLAVICDKRDITPMEFICSAIDSDYLIIKKFFKIGVEEEEKEEKKKE